MNVQKPVDITGLGVSTIDFFNVVDHFPDKEEVQKAERIDLDGGGPVATAIATAARLGAKTAMIDSIGDDWKGKLILEGFISGGVDINSITITKDSTSSIATILVRNNDGARTIIFSPGNAPELTEETIPLPIIAESKYLHMNGRHFSACMAGAAYAKKHGTKVSFDGGAHRYREELRPLVPLTDVCIVSRNFATAYTNTNKIPKAGTALLQEGPAIVVITDGVHGSYLFTHEISCHHQPAFKVTNVADTTGCGDSFHGAFLYGLCNNFDLYKTISFASAVAALNSLSLGGRKGLPDYDTVINFLSERQITNG